MLSCYDQRLTEEEIKLAEMTPLEISEMYLLDNLLTIQKTTHANTMGFSVGDKVVRETCPRCGGYGGSQMEDGWMPCFYCCEHGSVYTPLDLWIMGEYHLEALEEYSLHQAMLKAEMEAIQLMHRQETRHGDPADAGINKKGDFVESCCEKDDDIPF